MSKKSLAGGMTTLQVSEVVGCTQQCVRNYIKRGVLQASRIGKLWVVKPHDLRVFMADMVKRNSESA